MGLWNNHRLRQAGRYAKASYRLQRWQAEREEATRQEVRAFLRRQDRIALELEIRRIEAAPPRPDRPALPGSEEAGP